MQHVAAPRRPWGLPHDDIYLEAPSCPFCNQLPPNSSLVFGNMENIPYAKEIAALALVLVALVIFLRECASRAAAAAGGDATESATRCERGPMLTTNREPKGQRCP